MGCDVAECRSIDLASGQMLIALSAEEEHEMGVGRVSVLDSERREKNLPWITRPGPRALARRSFHGGQGEPRGSVSLHRDIKGFRPAPQCDQ